jgi:hypothetical protein
MRRYLITSVLALAIAGCAQSDNEPAELATEHKQIVTFTLDSTQWSASSDGSLPVIDEVITAEIGEEGGRRTFSLTAWNVANGNSSSISLYTHDAVAGQTVDLDGKQGRASFTSSVKGSSQQSFLTSDSLHSGTLTISTIDTALSRISGNFECKLGDLTISKGTFDIRYSPAKAM